MYFKLSYKRLRCEFKHDTRSKKFPKTSIGYSDHTLPDKNMSSLILACILGAEILEKHFTLNKKLKGNDHYHSMDYKDIKIFRKNYQIFHKKWVNQKTN